nr:hypothetical protein CFP56_46665 [Quercus suber]
MSFLREAHAVVQDRSCSSDLVHRNRIIRLDGGGEEWRCGAREPEKGRHRSTKAYGGEVGGSQGHQHIVIFVPIWL